MKVVIIGCGNVATVLGKKMNQAGVEILQVVGRNKVKGQELATIFSADFVSSYSDINKTADLYIIAISDTYIASVASKLKLKNTIIVHTAGSVSIKALRTAGTASCSYGVIYPLQSLKKEAKALPTIPVMVDGSDNHTLELLKNFCNGWSENVAVANDDHRFKMHVAAVFSSNFTTYMYVMAAEYCKGEGLDFKIMLPLIEETCSRLRIHSPAEVQTGPAVRKDIQTINMHIDLLSNYPRLQGMYKVLSAAILDQEFPQQ